MEKQVANTETKAVAEPITITAQDIKNLFCPLATEKEVALGLGIVKSLNLNPFLHECHFIKYSANDKMSIIVGYEVYIKRAERSGLLDGWKAGLDKQKGIAWVEIRRKDWKDPFYWEVSLDEFDKKQSTWKQIPSFMAKKVAIAQGFRLCFSTELAGMPYTSDEIQAFGITPKKTIPTVETPKEIEPLPQPQPQVIQDEPVIDVKEDIKPKLTEDISKKNLQNIRELMAKCKTIDELARLWAEETINYQEKWLPSDFDKATVSKNFFKKGLASKESQNGKN